MTFPYIKNIKVDNLLLIKNLDLSLESGLNVFTGESGAGKSVLLEAIALASGQRMTRSSVGSFHSTASVCLTFHIPQGHAIQHALHTRDTETTTQLTLERKISSSGVSKSYVQGKEVNLSRLREVSDALLEIQGQYDRHELFQPARHRPMLDAYGNIDLQKCSHMHQSMTQIIRQLKSLRQSKEDIDIDTYNYWLEELDKLGVEEGEVEELEERRMELKGRHKLYETIGRLRNSLDITSVYSNLHKATRQLDGLQSSETSSRIEKSLSSIWGEYEDIEGIFNEVESSLGGVVTDMENIESRLSELYEMSRKHGIATTDIYKLRASIKEKLDLIEANKAKIINLEKEYAELSRKFGVEVDRISDIRIETARKLEKSVNAELHGMELHIMNFSVRVDKLERVSWNGNGGDEVVFYVKQRGIAEAAEIHKSLSGGEISRLYLALKLSLSSSAGQNVMLFDEAESGVGGRLAEAVGGRLKRLAQYGQVLLVTHSPPIASLAKNHYTISKSYEDKVSYIEVHRLTAEERIEEIARMLSGAKVGTEARATAKFMLEGVNV